MDTFRFYPELLEFRAEVISQLSQEGFEWLSHYRSVDPDHDDYGIEVCGIEDREIAQDILRVLIGMFPQWRHKRCCYKDFGVEIGWKVEVSRLPHGRDRDWRFSSSEG